MKNCLFLHYLVHPVDSLVVLLQACNLATQNLHFAFHVVNADLEVVVFVEKLSIFILEAGCMALLVFHVALQSRALTVPEVDFVAVLSSALFEKL